MDPSDVKLPVDLTDDQRAFALEQIAAKDRNANRPKVAALVAECNKAAALYQARTTPAQRERDVRRAQLFREAMMRRRHRFDALDAARDDLGDQESIMVAVLREIDRKMRPPLPRCGCTTRAARSRHHRGRPTARAPARSSEADPPPQCRGRQR